MNYALILGSVFVVHILAMVSPGPNFLIVTQTAISRTRRAGILTALGVATGAAFWSTRARLRIGVAKMSTGPAEGTGLAGARGGSDPLP